LIGNYYRGNITFGYENFAERSVGFFASFFLKKKLALFPLGLLINFHFCRNATK